MGKTEQDIVNLFVVETGKKPSGTSLKNCLDFAAVILTMEKDADKASPSTRHCLDYASRAQTGKTISHQTFYNDKILNEMLNWYLGRSKKRKIPAKKADEVTVLQNIIKKKDKQIKNLVRDAQVMDSLLCELKAAKDKEIENYILLQRALDLLSKKGLDHYLDMRVSQDEIGAYYNNSMSSLLRDYGSAEQLEQSIEVEIDEQ